MRVDPFPEKVEFIPRVSMLEKVSAEELDKLPEIPDILHVGK